MDLQEISRNIEHIEWLARNLSTTDHLRDTLNFKLTSAYTKLRNLLPKRHKRGLINGLGKIVKFIAGNPDQEDLDLINNNLVSLEKAENHIIQNQNRQVKINLGIQNTVNMISDTVSKIKVQMFSNINRLNEEIEIVNLILNLDILVKIIEDLGEQITFAKSNLLNVNILTAKEKQYIYKSLTDQNINVNFENEITEFVHCIVTVKDNLVFIIVKIPIVDPKEFDLLQLEAIDINGSRIDTHVRHVARNRDTIYEQLNPCVLCESSHPLHDNCIFNIISNQKAKCSTVKTQSQTRISEIKPGIILVDTNTAIEILDSCADNRMISTPTIVETENCTVKISNFTFKTSESIIDQPDYFIPLLGNKVEIDKHKPNIDEIHQLNIKNVEELKEVKLRLTHNNAIGGVIITSFGVLLLILFYLHRRRNTIQNLVISKLPQTIMEVNLHALEATKGTTSDPTTENSEHPTNEREGTPEPEVNRGRLTLVGGDVTREPPW